ncbi:unnamed protein product [Moneuplotes crassus]|uniref:Uncharacterized protein n=1 Tax=Euplotes crassus TaxID=5936 RepID=A0AAD1UDF6_EUPCR|nr:unnamed protein product [Moneuplotes crassus]
MVNWHYDSAGFLVCCGITEVACILALIMLFINMRKHYYAEYSAESKVAMFISFVTLGVILVLIMIASPVYKGASVFLIVINILNSLFILSFYLLVSEKLTFYLWKFCTEYPAMKRRIVQERIPCQKMFKYQYPMTELEVFDRLEIRNYFMKYCYLLEGRSRALYFCSFNIKTYAEAHSFVRESMIILFIYITTVPIAMIVEVGIGAANPTGSGELSFKSSIRIYIMVITTIASVCLRNFCSSFSRILPFNNFGIILMSLAQIKLFFDFSGSILKASAWRLGEINELDTYRLIFMSTFAVFCLVITVVQYFKLDPQSLVLDFGTSMTIDFTWHDRDHQLKNTHSDCDQSWMSAPSSPAKFRRLQDRGAFVDLSDQQETPPEQSFYRDNLWTFSNKSSISECNGPIELGNRCSQPLLNIDFGESKQ